MRQIGEISTYAKNVSDWYNFTQNNNYAQLCYPKIHLYIQLFKTIKLNTFDIIALFLYEKKYKSCKKTAHKQHLLVGYFLFIIC